MIRVRLDRGQITNTADLSQTESSLSWSSSAQLTQARSELMINCKIKLRKYYWRNS